MVPINEGSNGGSQCSFQAQSEACERRAWSDQAEAWAPGLDGARAGGV
jgi:hypothetical protein